MYTVPPNIYLHWFSVSKAQFLVLNKLFCNLKGLCHEISKAQIGHQLRSCIATDMF